MLNSTLPRPTAQVSPVDVAPVGPDRPGWYLAIKHWCLGRVIYTYLELRRVDSLLTQRRDQALRTLGDVCRAIKREILCALVEWLYDIFQASQNTQVACALLGV